jgi:hypothetical protein
MNMCRTSPVFRPTCAEHLPPLEFRGLIMLSEYLLGILKTYTLLISKLKNKSLKR